MEGEVNLCTAVLLAAGGGVEGWLSWVFFVVNVS